MRDRVQVTFLPEQLVSEVPRCTTLFVAAHWVDLPIDSTCGGLGTCGRCRVRIDDPQVPIHAVDREWLTPVELSQGWRLACRAEADEDLECWVPESMQMPLSAIGGAGRAVKVEPAVRKLVVDLEIAHPPQAETVEEEIWKSLDAEGLGSVRIPAEVVRYLADTSVVQDARFTLTFCDHHLLGAEPGDSSDR